MHIPDLLKWIARPCPISHGYTPVSCALAGLLTRRARGPQEHRPQWTKTSRTSSIFVNFGTLRNLVCLTPAQPPGLAFRFPPLCCALPLLLRLDTSH